MLSYKNHPNNLYKILDDIYVLKSHDQHLLYLKNLSFLHNISFKVLPTLKTFICNYILRGYLFHTLKTP